MGFKQGIPSRMLLDAPALDGFPAKANESQPALRSFNTE